MDRAKVGQASRLPGAEGASDSAAARPGQARRLPYAAAHGRPPRGRLPIDGTPRTGPNNPAQGNALGIAGPTRPSPVRAQQKPWPMPMAAMDYFALSGLTRLQGYGLPGRCPTAVELSAREPADGDIPTLTPTLTRNLNRFRSLESKSRSRSESKNMLRPLISTPVGRCPGLNYCSLSG